MTQKNRYKKYSKISEIKFRQILKLFCIDLTATQISELTGLNRNTVNKYLKLIRQQTAKICESRIQAIFRDDPIFSERILAEAMALILLHNP